MLRLTIDQENPRREGVFTPRPNLEINLTFWAAYELHFLLLQIARPDQFDQVHKDPDYHQSIYDNLSAFMGGQ